MKVAMVPQVSKTNPYVTLLRDALSGLAIDVSALSTKAALSSPPAILHYHWPQNVVVRRSVVRGLRNASATLLRMYWLRRKGTRVIWTVHNLQAHSARSRWLEAIYMRMFTQSVDGLIFLDPSLRDEAIRKFPALAGKPWASIPHGIYGAAGSKARKPEYRKRFGLPESGKVIGFIGDIRPYKGLASVLDAFENSREPLPLLFVAGAFAGNQQAEPLRRRIEKLQAAGHRIVHLERRLDDNEIAEAIRACDAMLLPYLAGSNSGLAVLGLEAQVPLICSDLPMFRSMQAEIGGYWVRIVSDWNGTGLNAAVEATASPADDNSWASFIEQRQWPNVAALTRAFYREVGVRAG